MPQQQPTWFSGGNGAREEQAIEIADTTVKYNIAIKEVTI